MISTTTLKPVKNADWNTPAPHPLPTPNQDPKYCFLNDRIWSHNGGYWIPEDEPVIVFRGKDQASIAAIIGYLSCLEKQVQTEHVKEHIKTAKERLNAFADFQDSNPERIGIGCGLVEKLREVI